MLGPSTRRLLAAASFLWIAPTSSLLAQTTQSEPLIVTGTSREQTEAFVDQMSIASDSAEQLARWDQSVCTSIVGLPQRQGQYLADRIAQRALAVGLQPGAPGCQANVAVFVSADSNATTRRLFEEDRSLFGYHTENNLNTLGQAAFDDFLNTPRAVRWWHVAQTIGADGSPLSGDASVGGVSNAPVARSSGSRLRSDTRQDLARVIIVVDSRRVGSVQLATLADYVAMVALAQIDTQANTAAFPTIMNLFADNGQPQAAMTDWDLAFLDALYSATRYAPNVQQQQREIASRMVSGQRQGDS